MQRNCEGAEGEGPASVLGKLFEGQIQEEKGCAQKRSTPLQSSPNHHFFLQIVFWNKIHVSNPFFPLQFIRGEFTGTI